jgi:hypothetical protein
MANDAKSLPAPTPCNWLGPTTFAKRPEQFMGVPMFFGVKRYYKLKSSLIRTVFRRETSMIFPSNIVSS